MRKHPENWEVFYNHIATLIKNLFIKNINYTNGYYPYNYEGVTKLLKDTQERGDYILEEMERTKHLIDITDKEFTALQKERDEAVEIIKTDESMLHGVEYATHYRRKKDFLRSIEDKKEIDNETNM